VSISFNNPPVRVSDPRNPNKLVLAPKDWVSWFQEHPYLDTSDPKPTSVGGVEGRLLATEASTLPEDYYSEDCLGVGSHYGPSLMGTTGAPRKRVSSGPSSWMVSRTKR
jgi:hypothetical protein